MDLIALKIQPNRTLLPCLSRIRKFDASLPIGEIKRRIEAQEPAVEFDLEYYDVVEDLNGIDRKAHFRQLISDLLELGASIELFHNGEPTTLVLLDNWLLTLEEINRTIERDSNRSDTE